MLTRHRKNTGKGQLPPYKPIDEKDDTKKGRPGYWGPKDTDLPKEWHVKRSHVREVGGIELRVPRAVSVPASNSATTALSSSSSSSSPPSAAPPTASEQVTDQPVPSPSPQPNSKADSKGKGGNKSKADDTHLLKPLPTPTRKAHDEHPSFPRTTKGAAAPNLHAARPLQAHDVEAPMLREATEFAPIGIENARRRAVSRRSGFHAPRVALVEGPGLVLPSMQELGSFRRGLQGETGETRGKVGGEAALGRVVREGRGAGVRSMGRIMRGLKRGGVEDVMVRPSFGYLEEGRKRMREEIEKVRPKAPGFDVKVTEREDVIFLGSTERGREMEAIRDEPLDDVPENVQREPEREIRRRWMEGMKWSFLMDAWDHAWDRATLEEQKEQVDWRSREYVDSLPLRKEARNELARVVPTRDMLAVPPRRGEQIAFNRFLSDKEQPQPMDKARKARVESYLADQRETMRTPALKLDTLAKARGGHTAADSGHMQPHGPWARPVAKKLTPTPNGVGHAKKKKKKRSASSTSDDMYFETLEPPGRLGRPAKRTRQPTATRSPPDQVPALTQDDTASNDTPSASSEAGMASPPGPSPKRKPAKRRKWLASELEADKEAEPRKLNLQDEIAAIARHAEKNSSAGRTPRARKAARMFEQ